MTASDARLAEIQALIAEARTPIYASTSDEVWGNNGRSRADNDDLIERLTAALEEVPALLSAARADGWDEGTRAAFDYEEAIRRGTAENFMTPNPYRSQETQ